MSKVAAICSAIRGHAYIEQPLQDYHTARTIRDAMRCKAPEKRLMRIREALNKYRVTSWIGDGETIVLRVQGKDILVLSSKV